MTYCSIFAICIDIRSIFDSWRSLLGPPSSEGILVYVFWLTKDTNYYYINDCTGILMGCHQISQLRLVDWGTLNSPNNGKGRGSLDLDLHGTFPSVVRYVSRAQLFSLHHVYSWLCSHTLILLGFAFVVVSYKRFNLYISFLLFYLIEWCPFA